MSWRPAEEVTYNQPSTDINNAPVRALFLDAGPMALIDQAHRPGIAGVQFVGVELGDIPIPDYKKQRMAKQEAHDQSPQLPQSAGMLKASF